MRRRPCSFSRRRWRFCRLRGSSCSRPNRLATRTGDAVGGLLNATFGNAPELIIGAGGAQGRLFRHGSRLDHRRDSRQPAAGHGRGVLSRRAAVSHAGLQRGRGAALQLDDVDLGDEPRRAQRVQSLLLAGRHHSRGEAREPRHGIRPAGRIRFVSRVPPEDAPGLSSRASRSARQNTGTKVRNGASAGPSAA